MRTFPKAPVESDTDSDLPRSNIHQDINWENNNKIWDGWSRLVMIPVSHTGGREFKSLPIHSLQSRNFWTLNLSFG